MVPPKLCDKNSNTLSIAYKNFYYPAISKLPKKYVVDKHTYNNIINGVLKKARKGSVEMQGGVVIDGLGYLANWVSPNKSPYTVFNTQELDWRLGDNDWFYTQSLFTNIFDSSRLDGWSMEGATFASVEMKERVRKGYKYKLYFKLMLSLYRNNKISYGYRTGRLKKKYNADK